MIKEEVLALLDETLGQVKADLLSDITNQPANRDGLLAQLDVLVKLGDKIHCLLYTSLSPRD